MVDSTDPQGNARVAFQNVSGVAKVTQENSYYGYGLLMPGSLVGFSAPPNKNLYNGRSEWQNDTKAVNAGVPECKTKSIIQSINKSPSYV